MVIEKERINDFIVISVNGEIVVQSILVLKQEFESLMKERVFYIAIDMKDVNFIDSSAIGLLVNMNKKILKTDGFFCIFNITKNVQNLLEVSSCLDFLNNFKTKKEFLESTTI